MNRHYTVEPNGYSEPQLYAVVLRANLATSPRPLATFNKGRGMPYEAAQRAAYQLNLIRTSVQATRVYNGNHTW